MVGNRLNKETVHQILKTVDDPELAGVSIVDLGMIDQIDVTSSGKIFVRLIPTFTGCPALDFIERQVVQALQQQGFTRIDVAFSFDLPWSTTRITKAGIASLRQNGIAVPTTPDEDFNWEVNCPYCESLFTSVDNLFGPTACRSILYCHHCKNPFEAMKPIHS
ncbi:phenylacetate-CoA oxygenase, PaaJ subunit [Geomicrobium sp. JCM 19037]|uniref:1,2-phenylacetyl-CoA epoxidase subunit PaaD n=1 Tax=unclassified Geomicrobium TaxID=2628951 RepID=UPI00045F3108|nr:1,2-phenylacetyl-CoA epoxidase subunit PaaD [Geomicrobium sp. JCM 19037]GAK03145.1 phenylacetate-CoA oxygenase, PaaJ subunit [Geomicrobium sp. JCM 19037]